MTFQQAQLLVAPNILTYTIVPFTSHLIEAQSDYNQINLTLTAPNGFLYYIQSFTFINTTSNDSINIIKEQLLQNMLGIIQRFGNPKCC